MAINTFVPTSGDDFISLAAFPGFAPFPHQLHTASPPETSEGSPDSNPEKGAEAIHDDDPDEDEDGDLVEDQPRGPKCRPSIPGTASKRTKASSAERRATHNAIERARRESLNGRFLELANALPTMANVKRPSKSVIINKSLEWIYDSQIREHALVRENNSLRVELNDMRARLHMPPLPPPPPLPLASDYSRFKVNAPTPLTVPTVPHPLISAHPSSMPEKYLTGNPAVGSLTAIHHPGQFPAYGTTGVPAPPPSAPAHLMAFANPFNQQAFGTAFGEASVLVPQPASPAAKSEGGSDAGSAVRAVSADSMSDPGNLLSSPISFVPRSLDSLATSDAAAAAAATMAATQAGTYAALHAMRQQHLQALAASRHAQGQQPLSGCGTPGLTAAPWMSATNFGAGAQYMF